VTDVRKALVDFGWCPKRNAAQIVYDVRVWIEGHEGALKSLLE
jgi:hypothetical protein